MFRGRRRGFTLVELMIVMVLIAILLAMLFPALQSVLEGMRATSCKNNLKQLGIALQSGASDMSASMFFIDTQTDPQDPRKVLSADKMPDEVDLGSLQAGQTGTDSSGTPYSFFVRLLPHLGETDLERDFDYDVGPFDDGTKDQNADRPWGGNPGLGATIIPSLQCPSFKGTGQSEAEAYSSFNQNRPALTQYKAMGGSTLDVMLSRSECNKPSGEGGVIHPWKRASIRRASNRAILLTETKEAEYAAWVDGVYASIPGIIPNPDGGGSNGIVALNIGRDPGDDEEEGAQPFLSSNSTVGDGSGGDGGSTSSRLGTEDLSWGPSSYHVKIVNHLFVGSNVESIDQEVDARAYRAMITRKGNDDREIGDALSKASE